MIKAVFFDVDDTLFHFTKANQCGMQAVEKYLWETCGISEQLLRDAIQSAQEKIGNRLGFDSAVFHNRQIRFQNALDILEIPIYPYACRMYDLYWGTVLEMTEPEPGIRDALKMLKKKNIYLGVGTDMTSYIQNKKLEKMHLAEYFDAVVTSEEAGADKPKAELFQLCIEKAKCLPQECLFIGDHAEKDFNGAVAAGMQALCYAKYSGKIQGDERKNIYSYEQFMAKYNLIK